MSLNTFRSDPSGIFGHYEYYERHQGMGQYDNLEGKGDHDIYDHPDCNHNQYDQVEEDNFHFDQATSE